MLKYTLPDFTAGLGLNLFFVRLARQLPDWMQPDVRIDSVYGCFPSCTMNGGRAFIRERYTPAQMEEAFSLLEENGVRPRLTFTNMLATVADLHDPYTRDIAEAAARHGGEAIVYSDEVGDYLRKRFGMRLVLSTTRAIEDIDELNAALARYDWVVLNYNKNKDRSFIGGVAAPERLEVMVNEFCVAGCPHRAAHYRHNSEDQKDGAMHPFECAANKADFFAHEPSHPVIFTDDEVRALHDECGVQYFKIVGRGVPFATVLEAYVYYLVRPEYREDVRRQVMRLAG